MRKRDIYFILASVVLFLHLMINSGFDYFDGKRWNAIMTNVLKVDCNQYGRIQDLEDRINQLEVSLANVAAKK